MPTYSKETALYDTGAIAAGIDAAGDTADTYITAVDQNGIKVHAANNGNSNYAAIDTTGMDVVRGGTSMAKFGETTRIGKAYVSGASDNESHMELDYHSMQLINKNNSTYFYVSDLRGSDGTASITETFTGDGTTKSFSLAIEAVNTTYTVTVSDSSGGSVTKSTLMITFQTAPTSGAVITATYSTNNTKAVAFTFGLREIGSFVGPVSTSEGWGTRATALCSHAEGYATKATKRYSHAEGFDTEASGEQSHAEGYDCTASGFSAHAEGQSSEAIKSCAHAEGTQTHASGLSSHAEGKTTSASGEASHSEGFGTSATQAYSHAEGNQTKAKMGSSHAEGLYSIANGYTSHAEGYSTTTNGEAAHAEGRGTTADGNYSHAEGYLTTAGPYAHAEGWSTNASGQYSHTEGYETTASSYGSHAEGAGSSATGYYTHAQNHGTVAVKNSQTAIGKYNEEDTSSGEYGTHALIIGNGTADDARSNALMIDWEGYVYPLATKMTDFIIEQGTSGIWTYRKWHSGISECWGTYSASIAVNTASAGYGGYRSAEVTATAYPTDLFNAVPSVTMTASGSGGYWVNNASGGTSTNAKFYLSSGASLSAASRGVNIHAFGKWK